MDNYKQIRATIEERLGEEKFYSALCHSGPWASVTSRVILDNTEHHADAVVERLMGFVDCMLEQIRRYEPEYVTDFFTITADDERVQFDVTELALDSDEPEWQRWIDVRQRFLTGSRLEFESQFITEPDEKVHLSWGVPKLLEDLLEDGKLAQWVTLTVIQDNSDYTDWHEFRRPYHQDVWKEWAKDGENQTFQLFWMNGMYNGRYVMGEVPFEQDDAALMSISQWRMSVNTSPSDCGEGNQGIRLALDLNTRPELVVRGIRAMLKFRKDVACGVGVMKGFGLYEEDDLVSVNKGAGPMSDEDTFRFIRRLYDKLGILVDRPTDAALADMLSISVPKGLTPAEIELKNPTNEQAVRTYLDVFARLKTFFTDAEAEWITDYTKEIQEPLIRHAAGKYTDEEIQLYRFGISMLAILKIVPERIGYQSDFMRSFRDALPDEIRRKALVLLEKLKLNNAPYFVGMNDLSYDESSLLYNLRNGGMVLCIRDLTLYSRDDVLRVQTLLEELLEIARLAREASVDAPAESSGYPLFDTMNFFGEITAMF